MQEHIYPLETILAAISTYKKPNVKKRLIFDQSEMSGLGSKWLIGFFFLLPFIEAAFIFNPFIYSILGIAQAIIFFVVFLSIVMILIFTLAALNNAKAVKKMTASWNHYFPEIDLKLIVTSGATPYKNFYNHCSGAYNDGLRGEKLHFSLIESFGTMQEENKDLLDAMKKERSR